MRGCAHFVRCCAFSHGLESIEPCKTAVNAVLLRPLRGIGIDTMFLNEYERYAKCELRNMV